MTVRSNTCHQAYLANIGRLMDLFPLIFNRSNPLPLEKDVFEQIIALPDLGIDDDGLDYTLACWCNRREYCRSIVMLRRRYSLAGQPSTAFTDDELQREQSRYDRFIARGML